MRCPDCERFVAMDNGDPEVSDLEATWDEMSDHITVTAQVRLVRTCADCGTELKEANLDLDEAFDFASLDWAFARPAGWLDRIVDAINDGRLDVEAEEVEPYVQETGGLRGRSYAKNVITVTVPVTLRVVSTRGTRATCFSSLVELTGQEAASGFEECC